MSDTPDTIMDIHIWDHAQHISIPINGHYNLEPGRSYTLGELADMGNIFGLKCQESLQNYVPNTEFMKPTSTRDEQISYHLVMACMEARILNRCPQCLDHINAIDLYLYHPNFAHKKQPAPINPCLMNEANTTSFTYGINIPSGRLVAANDMRALVYPNTKHFTRTNEQDDRDILTAYANTGLLYIHAHSNVNIYATKTDDAYILGRIPPPEWHDEDNINNFLHALPTSHHPRDINGAPLASIDCQLWAVCAMDGDQVDNALGRFRPDDADAMRAHFTTIQVTPGYYQLTLPSARSVADGTTCILARVDNGATHPTPTITTFSMAEAIAALKSAEYHDFHPFAVCDKYMHWALGCPSPNNTGNFGETFTDITPLACDIAPLDALYDIHPSAFSIFGQQQALMQANPDLFSRIPRNIAPEAIACWIAGADATMRAIERHPGSKDFPAFSRHQVAAIYRVYEVFRCTLWGTAVANNTTDTVLAHITELRDLIDAA